MDSASAQPPQNTSDDLPPPPMPPPSPSTAPPATTELENEQVPTSEESKEAREQENLPEEEDIPPPPEEESEETMKLYPKKHLQELPKDEIFALKSALVVCASKMKYNTAEGAEGEVNADVLTRLILSRPSLLHGASWFVSQVDGMKDEKAKEECINDSNLFKSLLKIVLRDPIINRGSSKESPSEGKTSGVISLDVSIPSYEKMKSFLFYSKEHRKSFAVSSDKYGAMEVPNSFVNENNIHFYYLKQLIIVHKDKFHNNCHRHYPLDASYLHPPFEGSHASELLNTMPIWSHLDPFSDGFVNCENMGITKKEEIVVIAYKGRNFKRFDLTTCCPLNTCLDTVLPMDCAFLGCNISDDILQTTRTYDIGTETSNRTYEAVWTSCVSPSTSKRHLKERIKSIPHTAVHEWYRADKKIQVLVPPGTKGNRTEYHPNNPCKNLKDSIVVEKPVLDALWDEAKKESKVSVAHLHVMKNGDILCILEDTLWNKNFRKSDRPNYEKRGFTVLWYRFENKGGVTSSKHCTVTVVARFSFADFKKTAIFVNGKNAQPYPVNVRKYVTRENVGTFPNYGTYGKCDVKSNCGNKETSSCCPTTMLINRIVTANVTKCTMSDGKPGKKLSFAMLVDFVEFDARGNEKSVQDEIWSATCFVVPTEPFSLRGVVATRLNKEHLWGRVGNSHLKMSESGMAYTKLSNRGFYDRKRTRLNIETFDHGKGTECSCYVLSLSDFVGNNQKQTLVLSWSESQASIRDSSLAIPMLFPSVSGFSNIKKNPTEMDSLIKYEAEEINHMSTLSSHLLPGPFSTMHGSTIIGTSRRFSTTPVVLLHKARNFQVGKAVDTLSGFDVHVPSNSFTVYEKDFKNTTVATSENENMLVEENGDVNFDFDKGWLVDNLLVTIEHEKNYPCVRVYKMEIPESSGGGGSSTAKPNGSSFLLESTESLFLLNATKLGSRRIVNPGKFYGPRKSILGGVYKTKTHVALLVKDDPSLGGIRESSSFAKRHFGDKSHCGEIGQCKNVTDAKVLRVYSKLWKESWASDYYLSKQKLVDSPEKSIDSSINSSFQKQGATFSNSISKNIGSSLFYDFDTSKVCTNPKCKKAGCGPCEEKTDCVSWHFCSEKCQDACYERKDLFKSL